MALNDSFLSMISEEEGEEPRSPTEKQRLEAMLEHAVEQTDYFVDRLEEEERDNKVLRRENKLLVAANKTLEKKNKKLQAKLTKLEAKGGVMGKTVAMTKPPKRPVQARRPSRIYDLADDGKKLLGVGFKLLTKEQKREWRDRAEADKKRYNREVREYAKLLHDYNSVVVEAIRNARLVNSGAADLSTSSSSSASSSSAVSSFSSVASP